MAKSKHKKNNAKKKGQNKKTRAKKHKIKKDKVFRTHGETQWTSYDDWEWYDEYQVVEDYAKEEAEGLGLTFSEYIERVFEFHSELKDSFTHFGNPEYEKKDKPIEEHSDEEVAEHFGISLEEYIEKFTDFNLKTDD